MLVPEVIIHTQSLAWGENARTKLFLDVDGNITLYADLILLLWFKTEAGLSNSQLFLWLTPVGTVLGHTDLTGHIF